MKIKESPVMEIGEVVGLVVKDDGRVMYKIFNGNHHGKAAYWYRPVIVATPAEQPQPSDRQRKLDASVTPAQAAESVRREREALANRDKPHPQPDGFINDYD